MQDQEQQSFAVQFGRAVRASREEIGWTQAELVERVQGAGIALDGSGLSRIENGKRMPRFDEALGVARALGEPLSNLTPKLSEARDGFSRHLMIVSKLHHEAAEALVALARAQYDLALVTDLESDGIDEAWHSAATDWIEQGPQGVVEEAFRKLRAAEASEAVLNELDAESEGPAPAPDERVVDWRHLRQWQASWGMDG